MSRKNIDRLVAITAWIAILVITFATLTRVGFAYAIYFKLAPILGLEMKSYAHFEHVLAFALLGALFMVAYPRRLLLVLCVVCGGAVVLELAQIMTPDRHGTLIDALEKMAGGATGIMLTKILRRQWLRKSTLPDNREVKLPRSTSCM